MTDIDRKRAAKAFAEYWKDRGDEKSDSQSFWLSLARDVLGVAEPEKFILFEERVKLDHTSFIDGHIPSTHVLIEQKRRDLICVVLFVNRMVLCSILFSRHKDIRRHCLIRSVLVGSSLAILKSSLSMIWRSLQVSRKV